MNCHTLETDLLVAGGGMAGVCAAITAARAGIKVVLIQDRSVLGGNASSEIRMHIVGADCHGGRKGWRESGLIEELRLEDSVRNPERCYPLWDVILYEKVVAEPNITLLLDTDVVGVEKASGEVYPARPIRTDRLYEFNGPKGRIIAAKAVRQLTEDEFVIKAKFYADCTGDGRLGFEAGADFRIGRESRSMHGESLAVESDDIYTLGSSILITTRNAGKPVPFVAPPWARKFTPEQLKVGRGINSWEYGFWWIEWGGTLDTIKDNCTTIRHELYGIALGIWDYVKNSGLFPNSRDWVLDWIGALPGKRESRRFLGPHILTQSDVLEPPVHADEVSFGGWAIDLHPVKGMDAIDEPPYTPTHGKKPYGIPLRCLFSRNVENLFFAGRNISATHVAFASTRVMATCAANGQAIGAAAAICVAKEMMPSTLVADQSALQALRILLKRQDAALLSPTIDCNLAKAAKITATSGTSPQLVADGQVRDELDSKTGELLARHAWHSEALESGPQTLQLDWASPVLISEIRLTFDTGFTRELTLTASDWCNRHCIRGAQPETVRDYTVQINGETVATVTGNYQRQRVHQFASPLKTRTLAVIVSATNGVPEARIFEVMVY